MSGNVWDMVTAKAESTGHVTVTKHILREMYDTLPRTVAADEQRDRVPALEMMLEAALDRVRALEAELAKCRESASDQ